MVTYYGPMEELVIEPSDEFIRNIIFDKNQEYWRKGSGESCIEIDGYIEKLIFFYDEPYGFFIMRHPDYLVTLNRNAKVQTVIHNIGGEPMKIPTCTYISRNIAYTIIREFIETKAVPLFIEWVDLYEIQFDHGF